MDMTFSRNVLLAPYTTWRIGGTADRFVTANDVDELRQAVRHSPAVTVLGGGSNVLVSDKGVRGLTLRYAASRIEVQKGMVIADAGASLAKLASVCLQSHLGGMEWAAHIPASVGGACKMNAGAFGSDVSKTVQWVEVLRNGSVLRLSAAQCGFVERGAGFIPTDIVVRAAFRLADDNPQAIRQKMDEFRARRAASQPSGHSAGSVFKRVQSTDTAAGWYIDRAGFKGIRIGGAEVSRKHANFILNVGGASYGDVSRLIELIKIGVREQFGVVLEEEIRRIGEL